MSEEKKESIANGEGKEETMVATEGMDIISISDRDEVSIEREITKLEKNIELFNRIKTVALKLTKPTDWVDQGGSPYLMDRGAENIAIAFGVDISDIQLKMEWADDEKGRYYSFIATGKAYSKKLGRYVEDIGVCSQRDKFFGMVSGGFKPIEDVDMANIRRKAVTNLYGRLIKRVVGLSGVTFEDLTQAGIEKSSIQKIQYKKGGQSSKARLSPKGKETREKLGSMLLQMANEDKKMASKLLERYSIWKDEKGQEHKAASLTEMTERWINTTYRRVKKDFDRIGEPESKEEES